MTTLYERIGGAEAVAAAVAKLYEKLLGDALLRPFFESLNMQKQKMHLGAFLKFAFGGAEAYHGRSMRVVHAGLGLTNAHFDAVAGHLKAVLTELGVADATAAEVMGLVGTLRDEVLGR